MMGIIVSIFLEELPNGFLDNTFYHNVVPIRLAPAEGLFLNRITFETYNRNLDTIEPLLFDDMAESVINNFRNVLI